MSKPSTAAMRDRAAGVLVGLAAGDALGAPYEFGPPLSETPLMKAGGGWEHGEWTDDTSMAIAVAESAATGHLVATDVAANFLSWYGSGPKDVGIQTRHVLRAARDDATRVAAAAADYFEQNPSNSAGNGSLMRTAPVALAHLGDDDAIITSAREISNLTHADPIATQACVIWCIAIDRAVREGRSDGVYDGVEALKSAEAKTYWAERLREAEDMMPAEFTRNGWVVQALQGAWSAITHATGTTGPEHLRSGIEGAVAGGSDADTVGAIAGALLGATHGASAVPWEWKERLHGWPGYRVRDLVRLAQLAVGGGHPDSTGWPTAESTFDFYESSNHPKGIAVPLPEDPGLILGDIKGLQTIGHKADVVVSLCRTGTKEAPAGAEHVEVWLVDSGDPADNPNLEFVLTDTADLIARRRAEGKTVLLHCVRAERRTPAVAAVYLVTHLGVDASEAVAEARRQVGSALRPHPGWEVTILNLESGTSPGQ